jgi:hypothetical protein
MFEMLGDKCTRCGFSDIRILQLDHKNGGGVKDLKVFGNSPFRMYRYYVGHPDEAKEKLQVLCPNCNWLKRVEREEIRKPV